MGSGGSSYSSAPTVAIAGSATGTATINSDGEVNGIAVTAAGGSYTSAPAVTFSGGALEFSVEVREKNNTSATRTQTFSITKVQASAEDAASGFSATLSNVAHTFFAASGSAATNDYSGTFSIVSGTTTYTFASSGTTANTYGVSVTAATGGIATNQVNIASSSS